MYGSCPHSHLSVTLAIARALKSFWPIYCTRRRVKGKIRSRFPSVGFIPCLEAGVQTGRCKAVLASGLGVGSSCLHCHLSWRELASPVM